MAKTVKGGRLGLRTAVWLQAKVREHGLWLRHALFVGSVYDDSTTEAAVVAVCTFK